MNRKESERRVGTKKGNKHKTKGEGGIRYTRAEDRGEDGDGSSRVESVYVTNRKYQKLTIKGIIRYR